VQHILHPQPDDPGKENRTGEHERAQTAHKMHFNATLWLMHELHFKCNPLANITPTHKTKIFCMTWPQSDQKPKKEQPKSYLDQLPHGFVFGLYSHQKKQKKQNTNMEELV